jgi:sugar lactone lactonase YvrE
MQTLNTRTIAEGLVFGEAPRWHDDKLWISDMYGRRIVTVDLDGKIEEIVKVPARPSGLGWLPDGRLLVVSMEDSAMYTVVDGALQAYADLSDYVGGPPNDMVVDAQGRAYVGNFGFDMDAGEELKPADLLLVEDGKVRVAASDMVFANGIVIDPDGSRLIIAETFAGLLTAFDINPTDGSLSNRRTFAKVPDHTPDGICLDAEGGIWFGCFMSGNFVRVLEGGEITHKIDVGERAAVATMLGGEDRKKLFMLSAKTTPEELAKGNSTCRLDIADVEVPGVGLP